MIDYKVMPCERSEIRQFIEQHHYSKNINGVMSSYCFKLVDNSSELIGAAIFGNLAMVNQWKKYVDNKEDLIELRRLVLIDNTKRNAESFFIGRMLKWLKQNTAIKAVISYADPNYGHSGVIYKATNFKYLGRTSPGRVIIYNDKLYHDKTIRTKYKGQLKPFALKVKQALENGEAYYKKTLGKHIFLYTYNR